MKFAILEPTYKRLPQEESFWAVSFSPIGFVSAMSVEVALQRAKRMGFATPVIEPVRLQPTPQ